MDNGYWPQCFSHKEVSHKPDGTMVYCNRCGWNRVRNLRLGNPSGGWGTPSSRQYSR